MFRLNSDQLNSLAKLFSDIAKGVLVLIFLSFEDTAPVWVQIVKVLTYLSVAILFIILALVLLKVKETKKTQL